MTCSEFLDAVHELSVGTLAEPRRTELLAHAGVCASCRSALAETSDVADLLLHSSVDVEPPLGFEARAVARMAPAPPPAAVRPPPRPRRAVAVAAVALVACLGAGVVLGRVSAGDDDRVAAITTPAGQRIGEVELSSGRVILTMDRDAAWPGQWVCQLRTGAGQWTTVGAWSADDVIGRVWAAGAAEALVDDAQEMRVLNDAGTVVAVATLR